MNKILIFIKPYWIIIASVLVVLTLCVIFKWLDSYHSNELQRAITRSQELEGERNTAVAIAKQKEMEKINLQVKAQTQIMAAEKNTQTIIQLKKEVEKLKNQRPVEIMATPIEDAQDKVIQVQDEKLTNLEGAITNLQGSLETCGEEVAAYKNALKAEDARAAELTKALTHIPKFRPWSIGLIYGKTDNGVMQYGIHGSRSFGPLHLGVVAIPHFVGVEAGIQF